ncbi:Diaminopimelate epimerase protein [Haloplasma contractile SSD-17B]|uniref:Diaminopimelate epimerase protein n=2 Tax=Haloplasma TaxID=471824 RepID=U2FQS1_9MOLU|nr:Diaminopimelate epimerase protein [Haloplasma contractile SSD-17B]
MQFPYTKMETNGHSWIIIHEESLNKSILLSQLARNICHVGYGIGSDGILIVDEKYRPIPFVKAYNRDGKNVSVTDDSLRIIATYLLEKQTKNQLELNIDGNTIILVCRIKNTNSSVKYKLPDIHTEETIYMNESNVNTFSSQPNHTDYSITLDRAQFKLEGRSFITKRSNNRFFFIRQKTPSFICLDCIDGEVKDDPTDLEICEVLSILKNKKVIASDGLIHVQVPRGDLQGVCDYDSVYLSSKVQTITRGIFFY